ncbi:helix-turn-helix domain-containing protein [Streptomyces avidinii]
MAPWSSFIDNSTAYFDSATFTQAARRLSLSVRALTYRLERIHSLTGADPAIREPLHLQTAGDRGPLAERHTEA